MELTFRFVWAEILRTTSLSKACGLILDAVQLRPAEQLLEWLYLRSKRMHRSSLFVEALIRSLCVDWLQSNSKLLSIAQGAPEPQLAFRLGEGVIQFLLSKLEFAQDQHSLLDCLQSWIAVVVYRSFALDTDIMRVKLERISLELEGKVSMDIQNVLAIRLLTLSQENTERCLRMVSNSLTRSTFSLLVYSFGTIDRLYQCTRHLAAMNLEPLAVEILLILTNEYSSLKQQSGTIPVTTCLMDCRQLLKELQIKTLTSTNAKGYSHGCFYSLTG